MTNNEKQYYIYIRSTKERIPCTKEEFENYYHDIDLFRQKQEYHGLCVCPKRKRLECDMDCTTCPFRRNGTFSLDDTIKDEDGEETTWLETIPDDAPLFADILAEQEHLGELFKRLNEIMPQALEIGRLRLQGMSDTTIATKIGIPRKTFTDRIQKAQRILKKDFPELF
jgi:DNA-directed RNA polymerase specialized sigma24 family protein